MGADFRFGGLSGILGFWLCFVIDSFAQVSRPTLFFCFFLSFLAVPCLVILPFCLPICRRPHYFLPLFFIAYAMGLAFKKIVLRGFVGKLQGFFMRGRVVQKC
ncbi:hypothetical protein [Helicobacter cinaedi]|uniref:hypothetical protein n=1 Tax=Helicobacter cinaedi TaxID=213 RepID=UPI000E1FD388|nr:hypothetical protein [Helicobacter cinaedi]